MPAVDLDQTLVIIQHCGNQGHSPEVHINGRQFKIRGQIHIIFYPSNYVFTDKHQIIRADEKLVRRVRIECQAEKRKTQKES